MAINYNSRDNIFYGTKSERLNDIKIVISPTAKFYEYDTGDIYISDGTNWILM